jgi:hypothetical protein
MLCGLVPGRPDEENVFDRVLAKNFSRGGSLWWTGRYRPTTGFRAAVFLRARGGMRGQLRGFLQHRLASSAIAVDGSL